MLVSRCAALLLFLAVALPGQADRGAWESVGLSGSGGMFSPAISPVDGKRMLVHCDMGGAYFSEDGGKTWALIHHSQLAGNTGCRPAFHPDKATWAYSASGYEGRAVMQTRDGGRTWRRIGETPEPLRGEIAIHPDDARFMLAGAGNGVCRSLNGGETWTLCSEPGGNVIAFAFDRSARGDSGWTAFAATDYGIWRTGDSGATWKLITRGLPEGEILAFAGASRRRRSGTRGEVALYASVPCTLAGDEIKGGIYRSTDRGESWKPVSRRGLNNFTKRLDRWAMGDIAQYRWLVASDADPRRVYAFNSNTGVARPHHATVYRSDDAGQSWRATFHPDPRWEPSNVEKSYVVAEDNQYYQAVPFGMVVSDRDPDRILFVTAEMFLTENGGESWSCGFTRPAPGQKPAVGNRRNPGLRWLNNGLVVTSTWNYYFDPFLPDRHYIAYTDIGFAISDDAGKTWQWWSEAGRPPWRNTCYELAFDPTVKGRVWGAFSNVHDIPNDNIISERHRSEGPGGVCVSQDHAATWTALGGGLPLAPCTSIVLDPTSKPRARTLWAGFFGHGVYRSTDGGETWRAANDGLGHPDNMRVTKIVRHVDGTLFAAITARRRDGDYIAEGVGLYRSEDGGEAWRSITQGQRFRWIKDFSVDPKDSRTIYLGNSDARVAGSSDEQGGLYRTTDGGGTWRRLARQGPQTFGAYPHPRRPGWIYMTLTESAPGAGLWLSKDNGATFHAVEAFPFRNAQRVVFPPRGGGDIWVTTFGASVWKGPEG